jgi:hypothetical protein
MHFFTSSQCFWMVLTLQNLKLGGILEFSWYSCNSLRYCSNRCMVWFFIPANCPAQANRKFSLQQYVKIQILFELPFWICKWANHLSFLAMSTTTKPTLLKNFYASWLNLVVKYFKEHEYEQHLDLFHFIFIPSNIYKIYILY